MADIGSGAVALEDSTVVISFIVVIMFTAEDIATLLIYKDCVRSFEIFLVVLRVTLLDVFFEVPPLVGLVEIPLVIGFLLED